MSYLNTVAVCFRSIGSLLSNIMAVFTCGPQFLTSIISRSAAVASVGKCGITWGLSRVQLLTESDMVCWRGDRFFSFYSLSRFICPLKNYHVIMHHMHHVCLVLLARNPTLIELRQKNKKQTDNLMRTLLAMTWLIYAVVKQELFLKILNMKKWQWRNRSLQLNNLMWPFYTAIFPPYLSFIFTSSPGSWVREVIILVSH